MFTVKTPKTGALGPLSLLRTSENNCVITSWVVSAFAVVLLRLCRKASPASTISCPMRVLHPSEFASLISQLGHPRVVRYFFQNDAWEVPCITDDVTIRILQPRLGFHESPTLTLNDSLSVLKAGSTTRLRRFSCSCQ